MNRKKVQLVKIELEGVFVDAKECTSCGKVKSLDGYSPKKNGLGKTASQCKSCRKAYFDSRKTQKAEYDKSYRETNKEHLKEVHKSWWEKNRDEQNQKRMQRYFKNHEQELVNRKKYYIENRDTLAKYKKNYYKENRHKFIEYREKNKDRIIKYSKKKYQENKELYAKRWKEYYESNKEYLLAKNKEHYEVNKEKIAERWKRYSRSERGQEIIAKLNHMRREREAATIATLTAKQWEECKVYFNGCCAYCGKSGKMTKDHFVPVIKGGELAVKNVIPACPSCNSSKCDKDFSEWYPKQNFYFPSREKKILRYLDIKDNIQQISMF